MGLRGHWGCGSLGFGVEEVRGHWGHRVLGTLGSWVAGVVSLGLWVTVRIMVKVKMKMRFA